MSAIDYYYAVIDLAFNDFLESRDAVRSNQTPVMICNQLQKVTSRFRK